MKIKLRRPETEPSELSLVKEVSEKETMMERSAREADEILQTKRRDTLMHSIGLVAFLFFTIAAALTLSFSEGETRTTYLVMFVVTCVGIWLAAYRFRYIAVIIGGLQMLVYTVYRLYEAIIRAREITLLDYAWLFLPVLCIGAMILFMLNMYKVEKLTEILEDKLQGMETVEPITGLNNLRSMYMDLERQIAYSNRNGTELSLVIFELRYYQELKAIMNSVQLSELKRHMGRLVEDSLRVEDRVYAIDDKGSLGLICVGCGREGAQIVKKRIVAMLSQKESFEGIMDRKLRVDVRSGFYTYDREVIRNAIDFKQKAENELQYDV